MSETTPPLGHKGISLVLAETPLGTILTGAADTVTTTAAAVQEARVEVEGNREAVVTAAGEAARNAETATAEAGKAAGSASTSEAKAVEATTQANVARQAAASAVNPTQYRDDERPENKILLRSANGIGLAEWDDQARLDAIPSPTLIGRIAGQLPPPVLPDDLSVSSLTADEVVLSGEADGEKPLIPVIAMADHKMILARDAAGRLAFNATPDTARTIRRSPMDGYTVAGRAPTDTDTVGFSAGHEWGAPGGSVFVARSVGADAIWTPAVAAFPPAGDALAGGGLPLPGDAVPGLEPIFLAGLSRLRADYYGPIARFGRDSDSTTLDAASMAEAIAWARGTTLRIEGLFIQAGLLRGTLAPWAGTSRPAVAPAPQCGGGFAAVFENSVIYNGQQTPDQAIAIPAGVTAQSDNVAVLAVGCFSHSGRDVPVVELSGSTKLALGHSSQRGLESVAAYFAGWRSLGRYQPSLAGQVIALSSSPSGLTLYGSDRQTASFAALSSVALAGGTIGNTSDIFVAGDGVTRRNGGYMAGAVAIYGRGLSGDEIAAFRQSSVAHFNLRPQVRGTMDVLGDSITDGAFGTYFESTPRRLARLLQRPMNVRNFAISGATIASQTATFTSEVVPAFASGDAVNVLLINGLGTNDIGGTTMPTAQDMYAGTKGICDLARSTGYAAIVVGTVRPRAAFNADPTKEAVRLAFNDLLRAGYAADLGAALLIDFDLLWSTADANNNAYFADGSHQTDLARAREAAFVAPKIDGVIANLFA
ncbi:SGNH/GDSL hydrolase family protein [Roseomonas chloroacetimidivorans]|uniref:SGNH/GDSL hydrolase family protein n=1 Tax=Roseomonas chloroacetimidivorans TaxID=1766656 RepID=UPI003C75E5CD